MQSLQHLLEEKFGSTLRQISSYCTPNSKYISSFPKQEATYKRNVTVLIIYTCLILTCLSDIIINNGPVISNIVNIVFAMLAICCMFLSCRYHPEIFNIYYNLIVFIYGPSVIVFHPEEIVTAYLLVQVIPLFLHLITRSFWHFILQAIAQNVFLNTLYQKPMQQVITYESPETLLRHLTYSSNLTMVVQLILVVLIDRFLNSAYTQAAVSEHKKSQMEHQKNFLLEFSHELRNLINSLTGNVKLAGLERINDKAKDFLLSAEVCGELLFQLINNILDTGKAEISELEVNSTPTKTFEAFEKIWGVCAEIIQRKNLRGYMRLPQDLPRALIIDHHRLAQIFLNLVGNAIKFTEIGSIKIKVEWLANKETVEDTCFRPHPYAGIDDQDEGFSELPPQSAQNSGSFMTENFITLTAVNRKINKNILKSKNAAEKKGVLKITVTDTGCGMDQEQMNKLFQRFTQVTSDVSKKKLGVGLGLFITKQLCHKMQGDIRVYSKKGKGSSFVFCVPAELAPNDNKATMFDFDSMKAFIASKSIKAMIADKSRSNQATLKAYFEKLNIETIEMDENGSDAFQQYSNLPRINNQPVIVALSLDLLSMDGKEVSAKIRKLDIERKIKPCFLMLNSKDCSESDLNECMDQTGLIRANTFMKNLSNLEDLTKAIALYFSRMDVPRSRVDL